MKHGFCACALLGLIVGLTSGCGSLRQPALPRGAAAAVSPERPPDESWRESLSAAEVIYFSLTTNESGNAEAAAKIAGTWKATDFALGWTELPASTQASIEAWQKSPNAAGWSPDAFVRPEHRAILRRLFRPELTQVALGAPAELLRKLRDGVALEAADEALLPEEFQPAPDALENFADRVADSSRLRRYNLRRLFRAHLVAEETVAENIVRFRQAHANIRLLVFLPNDALIDPHEIAEFVRQKMPLRQIILDRAQPLRTLPPPLLAGARRRLQIVKGEPRIFRDDRSVPAPRLRA